MSRPTPETRRRYNASEAGRVSRRRYAATPKGRAVQSDAKRRWNAANVDKVKAASARRFVGIIGQINAIKVAAGCADCGYRAHPAALDFDHLDGAEKLANVSALIRRKPWAEIEAEIAKCEVVCSNCHRVRTYERWRR